MNKLYSMDAAIKRYGPIDLTSLHWENSAQWIKMFEVPQGVFPNWKVMRTDHPVKHIACNIDIHEPLKLALNAVVNRGLQDQLLTFDGSWCIRLVRGGTELSVHSYAIALDVNSATNQLGTPGDMSGDLALCFEDNGFRWGKRFHRQDPMHFTFAGWE